MTGTAPSPFSRRRRQPQRAEHRVHRILHGAEPRLFAQPLEHAPPERAGGAEQAPGERHAQRRVHVHHRQQADGELAELAGAKEVYEHAHEVGSTNGWLGHSDETGRRTRRLVEQPIVSPEAIKRLRTGEAVLISSREGLTTKRIRIEQAAS